jgi:hypothetical protein
MNALGSGSEKPPRTWTEGEKSLMVKQAGERTRQQCVHGNEQVAARLLPVDAHMSDDEIALTIKHAEETAALDLTAQIEGSALQYRHACAKDEMLARHRNEKAALKKNL